MMIRSLHIIGSSQLGGAESFFLRLVRALGKREDHEALSVVRSASPLRRALAEEPESFLLPMWNGWDFWSAARIRQLVRRSGVQIVQTYMGRATRLTRLGQDAGALHVARLGGYYKVDGYYRHASAWVGNTRGICDYLVAQGLPAGRVFFIGNFVDLPDPAMPEENLSLRRTLRIPEQALVLFSLGRFIEKKGFQDLIEAFGRMPANLHDRPLFLVLAGDGPLAGGLRELIRQLGLEPRVRLAGWIERPTPYFRMADLFVCPSRIEPLGNVILEAWAHGLPVVSTATAGALELIQDGRDGLLTATGNAPQLAARCLDLLQQGPEVISALAQAGSEKLQREHAEGAIVASYLEMYGQLLGGGR